MTKYIDKSALVAEIEKRIKEISEEFQESKYIQYTLLGKINALENLLPFLDTLEVKDANEALRTEYEKGRADAIAEIQKKWSEEDDKMCQETIDWFEKKCFPYALENDNPARESIKWLKSLKNKVQPQNTWKPSDEQMLALKNAEGIVGCLTIIGGQLKSLYEDLKKLKGE